MISWPLVLVKIGNVFLGRYAETKEKGDFKILIVRFRRRNESTPSVGIGDLVLLTPFLRMLQTVYPNCKVDFVVSPYQSSLFENCPYLHRIIEYEYTNFYSMLRLTRELRKNNYNLLFFPRYGLSKWFVNLFCYLTQAKKRITYSEHVSVLKESRQKDYDLLFTHTYIDKSVVHEACRYPKLIYFEQNKLESFPESVGKLELWPSQKDQDFADRVISGLHKRVLIVLGISARSNRRKWPMDSWKQFMESIITKVPNCTFVIMGGADAVHDAQELTNKFPKNVLDLTGSMSYLETYSIMKRCNLYCGNDSGGIHIAAAAGLSCIEISCHPLTGSSSHSNAPERFSPYGVRCLIMRPNKPAEEKCIYGCVMEEHHCIKQVQPKEVVEGALSMLNI